MAYGELLRRGRHGVVGSGGGGSIPDAPTIGSATKGNNSASVAFTPRYNGGRPITGFKVTSTPGGVTATGASSPIIVAGLTNGTAYTFTVDATNAIGVSLESAASNSVTPAVGGGGGSAPSAPTIGTATAGASSASVAFTPGSDGGSAVTFFTVTSSPGGVQTSGSASPVVISGLTPGTAYTFTVTATNAIGTSPSSGASNSVTPITGGGVPAIWSDRLADLNSVNVHTAYGGSIYRVTPATYASPIAAMEYALNYIGARHVRDQLSLNNTTQRAAINAFHTDLGIDCLFTSGSLWNAVTPPTASAVATDISTNYAGSVTAVEGLNESDGSNSGIPADWASRTRTYQTSLATAIRGIGLVVVSPPMAYTSHMSLLGSVNADADVNALHTYDGGCQPGTTSSNNSYTNAITTSTVNTSSVKPRWLTECGDHTAIHTANGFPPVTEAVQGVYAPILMLEAYRAGITRAFRYELGDTQRDDAATNIQDHFGIFAWDAQTAPSWRPKPAATAIHNLMALVADPGATYTPSNIDVTFSGGGSDFRTLIFGKRDGTYILAVWRNTPVWNQSSTANAGTTITVSPQTITATFGVAQVVYRYQPSTSASSLQGTGTPVTTFAFPLAGECVLLKIG